MISETTPGVRGAQEKHPQQASVAKSLFRACSQPTPLHNGLLIYTTGVEHDLPLYLCTTGSDHHVWLQCTRVAQLTHLHRVLIAAATQTRDVHPDCLSTQTSYKDHNQH